MNTQIYDNYDKMSYEIAELIVAQINRKKNSLICIAGGDTPKKVCEYLIQFHQQNKVDFSQCFFISLDEWVGLDQSTKGSCFETLLTNLFTPLNLSKEQIVFFDGKSSDLNMECQKIESFIDSHGGIDFILLGIGMNGHLGFNEPRCDITKKVMVTDLAEKTKEVGKKYFTEHLELTQGISLGMQVISESHTIILMASGAHKADIIEQTINSTISNNIPTTLLRENSKTVLYLDKDAASKLK